jgi:uncharacterized protein YciI
VAHPAPDLFCVELCPTVGQKATQFARLRVGRPSLPVFVPSTSVANYFLVERAKGPAWDHTRPRREQNGWPDHAAFMDALSEQGFAVLVGPIGEGDGDNALLVVDASDEAAVRARLAEDPWGEDMLVTKSIRPWSVLIGADRLA